jgi:hypothetical protein
MSLGRHGWPFPDRRGLSLHSTPPVPPEPPPLVDPPPAPVGDPPRPSEPAPVPVPPSPPPVRAHARKHATAS